MELRGLNGIQHARNFCNRYGGKDEQKHASFTMYEGGYGRGAYVTIVKTRGELDVRKKRAKELAAELRLSKRS
jgi:hypothetical protein